MIELADNLIELDPESFIETEKPTTALRWRGGVLEQAFQIERMSTSGNHGGFRVEWRPVPTVHD